MFGSMCGVWECVGVWEGIGFFIEYTSQMHELFMK